MRKIFKIFIFIFLCVVILYFIWFIAVYFRELHKQNRAQEIIKSEIRKDSLRRKCDSIRAIKNINLGNIIYYSSSSNPFLEDIAFNNYGIYVQYISPQIKRNACDIRIMDDTLMARFGKIIFQTLENKSDSIYRILKLNNKYIDGIYKSARYEPIYRCSLDSLYAYIHIMLVKKGLMNLIKDTCCPDELVIDAVISAHGNLKNVRILKHVNSSIDQEIIKLMYNLPCSWIPARIENNISVDFRKKFHFYLRNL